jgi:hypothetical protein
LGLVKPTKKEKKMFCSGEVLGGDLPPKGTKPCAFKDVMHVGAVEIAKVRSALPVVDFRRAMPDQEFHDVFCIRNFMEYTKGEGSGVARICPNFDNENGVCKFWSACCEHVRDMTNRIVTKANAANQI